MQPKSQNKTKRKINGKVMAKAVCFLAVCTYVVCTLVKQQVILSKCDAVKEEYREKIAEAQMENQRLEDELKQAGTEEYLERVAREKLGLVKANERVFIDITQ